MFSSPGSGLVTIISGKAIALYHAGAALNFSSKLDVIYKCKNDFMSYTSVKRTK